MPRPWRVAEPLCLIFADTTRSFGLGTQVTPGGGGTHPPTSETLDCECDKPDFINYTWNLIKRTLRRLSLGGLILDVIIAYLIKSALRSRRAWGSSKWQRVQAKVDSSRLGGGWVWNCPTAEVAYTYQFAGQTYSAIDSNPFFLTETAEGQVTRLRPGEVAIVRVNPVQPTRSVLRQADQ